MLIMRLEAIMTQKRVNTRQLSEMTGIRWNTVDDMVKNKAKHWSPDNLDKIMVALGLDDIGQLIEYKKEQEG